jgi:hypothetical protein
MMRVAADLWLCPECMFAAVNGDLPEDEERSDTVEAGLSNLGPHLVPSFDLETGDGWEEFSRLTCGSCGEHRHGERFAFSILEECNGEVIVEE